MHIFFNNNDNFFFLSFNNNNNNNNNNNSDSFLFFCCCEKFRMCPAPSSQLLITVLFLLIERVDVPRQIC